MQSLDLIFCLDPGFSLSLSLDQLKPKLLKERSSWARGPNIVTTSEVLDILFEYIDTVCGCQHHSLTIVIGHLIYNGEIAGIL